MTTIKIIEMTGTEAVLNARAGYTHRVTVRTDANGHIVSNSTYHKDLESAQAKQTELLAPSATPKELSAKRLVVVNQLIDLTHKDPTADTAALYERIAEMSWEIDASCQESRDFVTA